MTRFQVDSDEVLSATGAARAALERIQAEAATLASILGNLQNSWGGQASGAFQSVVTRWSATQQQVAESAVSINDALSIAGAQYADTEAANTRLFAG